MTRQPGHLNGSKNKNFRGSNENWRTGSTCVGFSTRIISCGTITPETVAKKMEGRLSCRLVKRATRKLRERYTKLRSQVRMHNKDPKNAKGVKVKAQTIRSYIMTGKTTSEKLQGLKDTHPNIDNVIQTCISFRRMIAGEDDAPDIETWLQMADE